MTRYTRTPSLAAGLLLAMTLLLAACGDEPPDNGVPTFVGVNAEYRTEVDEPVSFEVTADDPDDDAVTITMEKGPETAQFVAPDAIGRFFWAPIASDAEAGGKEHEVIFAAVDARGARTTIKTVIIVEPTDGAPRFVTTNQRVLDLERTSSLTAEVKVKDEDSPQVDLTLENAPDGMDLVQLDAKSAEIKWTPTERQLEKKLVWGATIVADDGATDLVRQEFSVILVSKACGDEGVTIEHTPLGEQRGVNDYVVTAEIPDLDDGSEPTLFWRKGGDPSDTNGFEGVAMAMSAGSWEGTIPNPLLMGKTDDIFYFIVSVNNNDDGTGAVCASRAPDNGFYSFSAFPPGDMSCRTDAFEPNDDPSSAPPIDLSENSGYEAYNLSLCDDDRDLFAVDLAEGEGASILIIYRSEDGELSVRALGMDGESVLAESTNMIADEASVVFAAEGAGTHYIEVLGERNSYSLFVVKREGVDASCIDNQFEPNDSATSAIILPPDTYTGLKICPGDEDYFAVEIPTGSTLVARATFSHDQGDIDLFLRDFNEQVVARAVSSSDNEELIYTNDGGGSALHTLRIRHYDDAEKDYDLELIITEDAGDICSPDTMEPNDTADSVRNFQIDGDLTNFSATMCGDDDYYAFTGTAGTPVHAEVNFDPDEVDIDIAVLDTDLNVEAESAGIEGTEAIDFTPDADGTWFLHVYRYVNDMGKADYSLDITVGGGDPGNNDTNNVNNDTCRMEDAETNDAAALAFPIEGEEVLGLGLCVDDRDWWVISANAGQDILVDVIPDGTNGGDFFNGVLVELYASDASTVLDEGTEVNDVLSVGTSDTDSDVYLLKIENIDPDHFYNYRIEAVVL